MRTILIAATSVLMAGTATAQTYGVSHFGLPSILEASSTLDLGLVRASADGEVLLFLAHGDDLGRQIGSTRVHGGANPDVRVNVGAAPSVDVIAVLTVDGQTVARQRFDVERDGGPR